MFTSKAVVACPECGQEFTSRGISRHAKSSACGRVKAYIEDYMDKGYAPASFSVYRVASSPAMQDRVKHAKVKGSFDTFKYKGRRYQTTAFWVESWFGHAYTSLYNVVKNNHVLPYIYLYPAIFLSKTDDERDALLEMAVIRACHDYGHEL